MTDSELIGRDDERVALGEVLATGVLRPSAVIVEGEPGIGKTSLWRAALNAAAQGGAKVLCASPAGTEVDLAFGALADLLGPVLPSLEDRLPGPQRRALRVALLLEEPDGRAIDDRGVGAALLSGLRLLAQNGPVVVAVDDVQWLDSASGLALAFAARRIVDERVTFVLAARPRWAVPSLDPRRTFDAIGLTVLPVGPLSLGAIHKVLQVHLGLDLPRPTLRRLHEVSGGNPFFALEIGRALQSRGRIGPGEALPVPDTLDTLVRDRLERLPDATRRVLTLASLAGDPTVRVVGAGPGLDAAVRGDLLEVDGDRVRFTHPLLRSASEDLLGSAGRLEAHRHLATVVHDPEERARHLALGTDGPSEDVARDLDAAVERSIARGATDAAAALARLALQLTSAADRDALVRRRIVIAERDHATGEVSAAEQNIEDLLRDLAPGPLRARALLLQALLCEDDMSRATALGRQALQEAGPGEDALASVIRSQLSLSRFIEGDLAGATREGTAAVELARRSGGPREIAGAFAALGLADACAGRPHPQEFWDEALDAETALGPGDLDLIEAPSLVYGMQLMWADRPDAAREHMLKEETRALAEGHELRAYSAWFHLVELEIRCGRWPEAAAHARRMEEFVGQRGLEQSQGAAHFCAAWVAAHMGREAEARSAALAGIANGQAVNDTVFVSQCRCTLGFLELSLGNAAEADRHLRDLWPSLRALGYREPSIYPALHNAAEAAIHLGDLHAAAEMLTELHSLGEDLGSDWSLALAARGRAMLLGARGQLDDALTAFEDALAIHERLPVPFERARTLMALGALHRRRKEKRAGREALGQALATFEDLGAAIWARRTRADLARISGRTRSTALTETERRVAELVAEGHSNKQVASELFVTVRAVEANLTRIYAKLSIRGRADLVRAVLEATPED